MHLSKLSYYADFFICLALTALLAAGAIEPVSWRNGVTWLVSVGVGAMSWTLIEYSFHRWLYHSVPVIRDLHAAHHAQPNAYIGAPPLIAIVLILLVFYAPVVSTSALAASGLTSGMLLGYMAYMLVHHASHYWRSPASPWLRRARLHHALHHHHSDAINFGITTAFWDQVFGTALAPTRRVVAPLRL